ILPALSLDGILHLNVQEYSHTSVDFNHFISTFLNNINPFPQKNSVIVIDNANTHKSVLLNEIIEQRCV
ncbi:hypothetical protein EDD22DRAFT_786525, partial [Suillus occidentalis]